MRRNREKGFSLLEIMMAIGVMGVLTYVVAQMMTNSGKQATSVAAKSDFNSFVNQVQGVFNNTGSCISAIGDPATSPRKFITTPTDVTIKIGGVDYGVNTTFGGPGATQASKRSMTITKLQITGVKPNGSATTIDSHTTSGQYVIPLYLEASRGVAGANNKEDKNAIGGNIISHTFNLIATAKFDTISKEYTIQACAGQYTDFWTTTGVNGTDIIYTGGRVGVGPPNGLSDPPQAMLDVEGIVQAQMFMYRSDARMKENVREIPNALDRVLKLRGVRFDWKDRPHEAYSTNQLGLIAQEVEAVFPEAVNTSEGNGMKSVGYGNLIAPMIEAFKEQREILSRQQREIAELKKAVMKKQ